MNENEKIPRCLWEYYSRTLRKTEQPVFVVDVPVTMWYAVKAIDDRNEINARCVPLN